MNGFSNDASYGSLSSFSAGSPPISSLNGGAVATTSNIDAKGLTSSLARWRDDPSDEALLKQLQAQCLEYLITEPDHHWFCDISSTDDIDDDAKKQAIREIALFNIRLVGFKPAGKVQQWKDKLHALLAKGCMHCVAGWVEACKQLGDRYLKRRWKDEQVALWYTSLHKMEAQRICHELNPEDADPAGAISPSLLYNILIDENLYRDSTVVSALSEALHTRNFANDKPFADNLPFPCGVLALSLHNDAKIRKLAMAYIGQRTGKVSETEFSTIGNRVQAIVAQILDGISERDSVIDLTITASSTFEVGGVSVSPDDGEVWNALGRIVRILPIRKCDRLFSDDETQHNIFRLTANHLGDTGSHWLDVMTIFRALLEEVGSSAWRSVRHAHVKDKDRMSSGEGGLDVGYAGARLNDALDNANFLYYLAEATNKPPAERDQLEKNLFGFLYPLLRSLRNNALFSPCVNLTLSKLLEGLGQKGHIEASLASRAVYHCVTVLARIFHDSMPPSGTSKSVAVTSEWPGLDASMTYIEKHVPFLVKVAFDREYSQKPDWSAASQASRQLIDYIARRDAAVLREFTHSIADVNTVLAKHHNAVEKAKEKKAPLPTIDKTYVKRIDCPRLCGILGQHVADSLHSHFNEQGMISFIKSTSLTCYITKLRRADWVGRQYDSRLKDAVTFVNSAQEQLYSPVASMLRLLADSDLAVVKSVLQTDGVCDSLVQLIMCPNDDVAKNALSVVRNRFDVNDRRDCFRQLFRNMPQATFKGIIATIRDFRSSARSLPEVCEHARRLVNCLADIVEVLADKDELLLRDKQWMAKHQLAAQVSKVWNLICESATIIFEKTEIWAVFFESEWMMPWMRDTLAFMQEILNEVSTFQSAAIESTAATSESQEQVKTRAESMMTALDGPLKAMMAWLRLNDDQLLKETIDRVNEIIQKFIHEDHTIPEECVKRIHSYGEKFQNPKERKKYTLLPAHMDSIIRLFASQPKYKERFAPLAALKIYNKNFDELADQVKPKSKAAPSGQSTPIAIDSDDSDSVEVRSSVLTKSGTKNAGTSKVNGAVSSKVNGGAVTKQSGARMSGKVNGKTVTNARVRTTQPTGRQREMVYSHKAHARRTSTESDSDNEYAKANLADLAKAFPGKTIGQPQRSVKLAEDPKLTAVRRAAAANQSRIATAIAAPAVRPRSPLRVEVDVADLHREILQWSLEQKGALPTPGFRYARSIPPAFEDPRQYINTFVPLLLLECWNEICTARDEIQSGTSEVEALTVRMAGRDSIDDFIEAHFPVDRLPERTTYSDNDVIMLTNDSQLRILGKVQAMTRSQNKLNMTVRLNLMRDNGSASRSLVAGSQWTIHKLFSLSTVHREYIAVSSISNYDLLEEILVPPQRDKPNYDDAYLERAIAAYRVNRPQAAAIVSSLAAKGFSLIQGPPGTGKTKTILGLVGAWLSQRGRTSGKATVSKVSGIGGNEKILLCAPSNAAVDEIAKRLKDGVFDSSGKRFVPNIVRIGTDAAVNVSVKDVALDALVDAAISGDSGQSVAGEAAAKMKGLRDELAVLRSERDQKRNEKANVMDNSSALFTQLTAEIMIISRKIDDLSEQHDRERDKQKQSSKAQELTRRRVRGEILAAADVICCTLSGAGHDYLATYDFETVIVDEAAQSVEISSLIPLKYNCQRCIMVGDPNQLPPTVKSREATQAGYNTSLFVRLHNSAPQATHLLSIQYRMHPDISSFPSKAFYESRLTDGPDMASVTRQTWHDKGDRFPPYAFMHVKNSREEKGKHHSILNKEEAAVAVALYSRLIRECDTVDFKGRVGIITPYKGQVNELKFQFRRRFGKDVDTYVDFNTVDGFQGQEKDIIILSCVRGGTAEGSGIGFLSDTRRMNVALTRARSSLFILGDSNALKHNEYWGKLVSDAVERDFLRTVSVDSFSTSMPVSTIASVPPAIKSKGKAKFNDASKHIMSAPVGLMTPAELAKSTQNMAAGSNVNGGIKRRLSGVVKKEEADPAIPSVPISPARKKPKSTLAEAAMAAGMSRPVSVQKPATNGLAKSIKTEEAEEGEISEDAMSGVETAASKPMLRDLSAISGSVASGAESDATMSDARPVVKAAPVLLKRPAASSIFMPRKKPPGLLPKPPGQPSRP